uniref:Selenoprotein H n=1 Tax=Glossina pallidipes TaxID=7398 RepID=A0A1A9Z629_GLOPL
MPPKRKKAGAEDGASSTSKTTKGSSRTLKPNQPPDIELQLSLNAEGTPRRGSFEVAIAQEPAPPAKRIELWSGVKKTPRAGKFPPPEQLLEDIIKIINAIKKETENKPPLPGPSTRAVVFPINVADIFNPRGGISQIAVLILFGIHSTKWLIFLLRTLVIN